MAGGEGPRVTACLRGRDTRQPPGYGEAQVRKGHRCGRSLELQPLHAVESLLLPKKSRSGPLCPGVARGWMGPPSGLHLESGVLSDPP